MEQRKRGRPKKERLYEVWEHKYYVLDDKQNDKAIRRTIEERLFKGYSSVFSLAHGREPNQIDRGKINKVVAAIIDRI
jgi:hypothetical protein